MKRIIAAVLALLMMVSGCAKTEPAQTEQEQAEFTAFHTNAQNMPSYTVYYTMDGTKGYTYDYTNAEGLTVEVPAETAEAAMKQEVASCGTYTLDNRDLFYYYYDQLYQFYQTYASMISIILDSAIGLDEQMSMMDETLTWQQVFLNQGKDMMHRVAAAATYAKENGITTEFDGETIRTQMESVALEQGCEDVDEFVKAYFGAGADFESYLKFYEMQELYNAVLMGFQEKHALSDEELEAYYAENLDLCNQQYGIWKDTVAVRHILITPVVEEGASDATEEAWADAEAEAQKIYEQWQSGAADEDFFAELAGEFTQDPGSMESGGLYENVYPGEMVQAFNDWCFDEARETGDHDVVRTDYGYHIMYFVGEMESTTWKDSLSSMLVNDKLDEELTNLQLQYPMTYDETKVMLMEASAEQEAAIDAAEETAVQETSGY